MTTINLQYFGRYRHAEHCGFLDVHGALREVFFIDIYPARDHREHGLSRVIVRRTPGTDQAKEVFTVGDVAGTDDEGLKRLAAIEWLDNEIAARAKTWALGMLTERTDMLLATIKAVGGEQPAEVSPS
jgi:hypothetical protein